MEYANGKLIERTNEARELSDDDLNSVAGGFTTGFVRMMNAAELLTKLMRSTGETCPK